MDNNILSLLIGVGGILVGTVVTLAATHWSNKNSRALAMASGAFRHGIPTISFLGKDLVKNPIENTIWVLLCPKDAYHTVYSLSFGCWNKGDAVIDDPVFTVQGNSSCVRNVPTDALALKTVPAVIADSVKRSIVDLGNFNQISYRLPYISCNSSTKITDCFCFSPTLIQENLEVEDKCGTKMKLDMGLAFAYELSLSFLTREYSTVHSLLRFMCIGADDIAEAKELVKKTRVGGTNDNEHYYAFLKFGVNIRIEGEDKKIWYFMKDYHSDEFSMTVYKM
jgi:hypothetical protein